MFRGDRINVTEDRPALHVALRMPRGASLVVDGVDVVAQVHEVLDRMAAFADRVRSGDWTGHTGKPIRNVVNIGIGGSDLGPVMAYEALRHYARRDLTFRFVSNVDGTDFAEATRDLDPAETLFIVSSKTFTTLETMTNARTARDWLVAGLGDEAAVARHFVAVSTNADEVARVRHRPRRTCSGSGTGSAAATRWTPRSGSRRCSRSAPTAFREMLAGFHEMDEHFRTAPFERNLPGAHGPARRLVRRTSSAPRPWGVMPYDQYLKRFPAYLQQLTMESNGKHVTLDGDPVDYQTGAVYWGEPGTNGQHCFYQLLHQGTQLIPVDLIGFAQTPEPDRRPPRPADVERLRAGRGARLRQDRRARSAPRARRSGSCPHRVFEGNRPSTTILAERLTPRTLGALVALYEHSVFTQGAIWGIDSVRPVGRRARQGARAADHPRADERRRSPT